MPAETTAAIILTAYAGAATLIVTRMIRRSRIGWRAWLLYAVVRLYVGLAFKWRADRRCPFSSAGPALVIANHHSPVDPLLLWMNHHLGPEPRGIRILSFLMAKEYYDLPVLNGISRTMRCVPVNRNGNDTGSVRQALTRLGQGDVVAVFPEGQINSGRRLLPGNPGITWLALRAKVPVYPVFIHDAPRSQSMVAPFFRAGRVHVSYGEPIDLSLWWNKRMSREQLLEVTDLLMHRLAELGGVPYEPNRRSDARKPERQPATADGAPIGRPAGDRRYGERSRTAASRQISSKRPASDGRSKSPACGRVQSAAAPPSQPTREKTAAGEPILAAGTGS